MKNIRINKLSMSVRTLLPSFFCGLLLLLLIGWNSRKQDKILVFSKNVDNQPSAAAAARAFRTLAETADLTVDTTTNAAYMTEDSLKNYRAVVFLNTSQDVLLTGQQIDVERFVQAGGGLGLINVAGFTNYQWPWFQDMLSGNLAKPASGQPAVSFARKYDGGRVFYVATGTGSYDETTAKPLLDGIKSIMEGPALNYRNAHVARMPEENRFTANVLDSFMDEPIEMEVMSDG
ncbi:MAG TPA: ThuA domain-containing protein, partial [Hymenobacter sp.]|nr:ThuA domain-containing protein [Hymenobacter sp.]